MSQRWKWLLVGCLALTPSMALGQTTQPTNPLDEIIAQVKTGFRQQNRPTVIFDADGTIWISDQGFCGSFMSTPRTSFRRFALS